MAAPLFVVPVKDLERGERELVREIPLDWLEQALSGTDASVKEAPGRLEATLGKNGREVFVRGRVRAQLTMPCARTLDPVDVPIDAELMLLLSPPRQADNTGKRRKRRAKGAEDAEALSKEDAARDSYDGERVVLDGFVRELILLELPMVVRRADLHPEAEPAIPQPPNAPGPGDPTKKVDPRLAPLAEIASRLRNKE